VKLGVVVRNMGQAASRETVVACAQAAEEAALDDVWITDHIAIPPDDAEGSGGRYLDPLTTLAFLAGATERIGLGTGVLILPYRPPLPTAKAIATVQELSGNRLLLGVGVGWMAAEFRAVGIPRARRGQITDETLDFLNRCFASDEVESCGQPFLFLPRPPRPPIYVGGAPPHALDRAVRYGDGWFPMGGDAEKLAPAIAELRQRADSAGKPAPEVVLMTSLDTDSGRGAEQVGQLSEAGVTHLIQGFRYADASEFHRCLEGLVKNVLPAVRAA
jgi:probable F420-dependent oxidoreductase